MIALVGEGIGAIALGKKGGDRDERKVITLVAITLEKQGGNRTNRKAAQWE